MIYMLFKTLMDKVGTFREYVRTTMYLLYMGFFGAYEGIFGEQTARVLLQPYPHVGSEKKHRIVDVLKKKQSR